MRELQRVLQSRLRSAPEGSYTKRLFDDPTFLRNKLVEEAQELAEADEPDHVAAEMADVLYFAMVKCVAAGVTMKEVEAHLDRRALKIQRRPGNAKKERIDAAQKILAEGTAPPKVAPKDTPASPYIPPAVTFCLAALGILALAAHARRA